MPKISGIKDMLVSSMDYKDIKKSLWGATRRTIKTQPDNQVKDFTYGSNRILKFSLPATGFLDVMNSPLCFEAQYTGNGTNPSFNQGISAVINRLEIFTGDGRTQLELIQNYNLCDIADWKWMTDSGYATSISNVQAGYLSIADRQAIATDVRGYAINLNSSGILGVPMVGKYLPMGLLSRIGGFSRSIVVEITLEAPDYCTSSTITGIQANNYNITNPFFQLEILEMPEYENMLYDRIKNGETLAIPYLTHDLITSHLTANQQGEITFPMAEYREYMQGVKTIFKNNANGKNVVDATPGTDWTYNYQIPAGLQNYQYQIKDVMYPTLPLTIGPDNFAAQFNEILKFFGKTKQLQRSVVPDNASYPPTAGVNVTDFMIAQNLRTFFDSEPYINNVGEFFLDGLDTQNASQVTMRISTSQVQTGPLTLYHYFKFIGCMVLTPTGLNVLR